MWPLDAFNQEFNKKKVWIFGDESFSCQFENLEFFLKLTPDFENHYK